MSRRPQSADAQMKKIADKLQQFSQPHISKQRESLTLNALNIREMWDIWEMFRVLTLRIRDLEASAAAARRPDPELIKALAKLPPLDGGRS